MLAYVVLVKSSESLVTLQYLIGYSRYGHLKCAKMQKMDSRVKSGMFNAKLFLGTAF